MYYYIFVIFVNDVTSMTLTLALTFSLSGWNHGPPHCRSLQPLRGRQAAARQGGRRQQGR